MSKAQQLPTEELPSIHGESAYEAYTTLVQQPSEWVWCSASVYCPLESSRREIRLLHIEPADDYNADVHIRLSVASLDDGPRFHATSLAWGDPSKTRTIFLEGFEYIVTVNQ